MGPTHGGSPAKDLGRLPPVPHGYPLRTATWQDANMKHRRAGGWETGISGSAGGRRKRPAQAGPRRRPTRSREPAPAPSTRPANPSTRSRRTARLRAWDKLLWVLARRFCAGWREHIAIVTPDTV